MIATVELRNSTRKVDFSKPLDISIPLRAGMNNVNAWYVGPMTIEPVMTEHFTGSVLAGGTVNFRNIFFNPHGNGTHTECVGHISRQVYTINQVLKRFFFEALVVTIEPEKLTVENGFQQIGDEVITLAQVKAAVGNVRPEAIIIRTLPNPIVKNVRQYSNTNPPYLDHEAAIFLRDIGVDHLMIDLPSVDPELDAGRMLSHKAFWEYPENTQTQRTISELIYVADEIADGLYLLNLQIASFENDASPSKPILYEFRD